MIQLQYSNLQRLSDARWVSHCNLILFILSYPFILLPTLLFNSADDYPNWATSLIGLLTQFAGADRSSGYWPSVRQPLGKPLTKPEAYANLPVIRRRFRATEPSRLCFPHVIGFQMTVYWPCPLWEFCTGCFVKLSRHVFLQESWQLLRSDRWFNEAWAGHCRALPPLHVFASHPSLSWVRCSFKIRRVPGCVCMPRGRPRSGKINSASPWAEGEESLGQVDWIDFSLDFTGLLALAHQ